jgi:hypothetical protein
MNFIYKLRAILEDHEDFTIDLDLFPETTFLEFHHFLLTALKFDGKHDAVFYKSDDSWRKVEKIDFEKLGKEEIVDFVDTPRQKFIYYYDPENSDWCFNIEIIKISKLEDGEKHDPKITKITSVPPRQYVAPLISNDDEEEDEPKKRVITTRVKPTPTATATDDEEDVDDNDFYQDPDLIVDDREDIAANTDDVEVDEDMMEDDMMEDDFSESDGGGSDFDDDRY